MLAIRMQRTGRKGHAMFRVVVQDSRRTPTSGKIVASLGSYDPHAKTVTLDKEKASFFLEHGAQPSDRAALLLQKEGVKLPSWVSVVTDQKREVRNPDKRRSSRPAEVVEPQAPAVEAVAAPEAPVEETVAPEAAAEPAVVEDKAPETAEAATTPETDFDKA